MERAKWLKLLVLAILLFLINTFAFAGVDQALRTVLDSFLEPDTNAKPMARLWFPDAGALIKKGKNEITVRMNSTLYGRTYIEHSSYQEAGADYGMYTGLGASLNPGAYYNGLLGVKIIPYSKK